VFLAEQIVVQVIIILLGFKQKVIALLNDLLPIRRLRKSSVNFGFSKFTTLGFGMVIAIP
jgi:hypothetical protein